MTDRHWGGSFWRGRRVLVTGHTGFKGAWLSHWLSRVGADVTGYALAAPSSPNLFDAISLQNRVRHIHGDIRDADGIAKALATAKPEIVFHLAAQPLVRLSYAEPEATFTTNAIGTLTVLMAARAAGVRAFVNVTTDKCYENKEWLWAYREDEALGGHDPYSASKACAEIIATSFRRSFLTGPDSMRLASARAGNVLGGGDWGADRLFPDMMRAFALGQPVTIRNPGAIRPWQHALDALSGYVLLAATLLDETGNDACRAWNFGPERDSEVDVATLATKAARFWGPDARLDIGPAVAGPHEARFLKLDSTHARTLLRWRTPWRFDRVLLETVNWYRAFYDARTSSAPHLVEIMNAQIDAYLTEAVGGA